MSYMFDRPCYKCRMSTCDGACENKMPERIMTDANGRKYITREPLLHPSQCEWQGLTDEEINAGMDRAVLPIEMQQAFGAGARWAEAKLREKNT